MHVPRVEKLRVIGLDQYRMAQRGLRATDHGQLHAAIASLAGVALAVLVAALKVAPICAGHGLACEDECALSLGLADPGCACAYVNDCAANREDGQAPRMPEHQLMVAPRGVRKASGMALGAGR